MIRSVLGVVVTVPLGLMAVQSMSESGEHAATALKRADTARDKPNIMHSSHTRSTVLVKDTTGTSTTEYVR
jgi:hypothetical protein